MLMIIYPLKHSDDLKSSLPYIHYVIARAHLFFARSNPLVDVEIASGSASSQRHLLRAKGGQFNCFTSGLHNVKRFPCHAKEVDVNIRLLGFDAYFADLVDHTAPAVIDLGSHFVAFAQQSGSDLFCIEQWLLLILATSALAF